MPAPATPAVVTTHHATTAAPRTATVHVPALRTPNTADPNVQQGALYGAAAVALTGGALFGLYQLWQYYSARSAQYKLVYFNIRGLAETSRYLFALAHQEYEDQRFPSAPAGSTARPGFDEIKDQLPFGQAPVLQLGGDSSGLVIGQSKAIERFLARRFGFMGSSDVEAALVESIGEALVDCRTSYRKVQDSPEAKAGYWSGSFHTTMRYINRLANQHSKSADRNTLIGSGITLADAQLFHFLSIFDDQASVSRVVDQFPVVKASRANFGAQPEIQQWISKRPNTKD